MARPDSECASTSCNSPAMRLRSASAAAAASPSRASWSWASSSSVRSWLWRPRRMNWPVTASSRHNSVAVMADWAPGCPVRPTATASAAVIAPAATAAASGRQPDRGDPDSHARRDLDRPVRLQDGQCHPAAADQPGHRGLRGHAPASPAHADRGRDRRGVYRQHEGHAQASVSQARRGMSLRAQRHHDRDEHQAERPQRLPRSVPALAGARSRVRHPGRSGLVSPACGRSRARPCQATRQTRSRGAMSKARRGQPCPHGHSVARGGPGYQVRHRSLPGCGPR